MIREAVPPSTYRAVFAPVGSDADRPFWSVMIPTYNCAGFLRETLVSVLDQAPDSTRMQIEVVDDFSTRDDPEAVVREIGNGRVAFFRQPENVGHTRNFDTCIRRSRGHLVHILHGDDAVRPGFYRRMEEAFHADPELGAAFCRTEVVDQTGEPRFLTAAVQPKSGRLPAASEILAIDQPVATPAIVVRRSVYENVGGFDRRLRSCGEDLEMWVRIASRYPIWYESEPLARYRTHEISLSGASFRSGQNLRDMRCAIELFRPNLPQDLANSIIRRARQRAALWGVAIAIDGFAIGNYSLAFTQMREAIRCSRSPAVLRGILQAVTFWFRRWFRGRLPIRSEAYFADHRARDRPHETVEDR
jgi:glycosyltransferase involved in cell wall biosynthesis